jgi:hypothetical protein
LTWAEQVNTLPWKAGSGLVKGRRRGHFFFARVGGRHYPRFVPDGGGRVVRELATCLRMIQCGPDAERVVPDDLRAGAFAAWQKAQRDIFESWTFETEPRNLQPQVPRVCLEIGQFLREKPPRGVEEQRQRRCLDAVESPVPLREQTLLRAAFERSYPSTDAKARALLELIEQLGLEPFRAPEPLPPIRPADVQLICWLAIEASK